MKVSARLFLILMVFFIVLVAPIYSIATGWEELVGTVALFLTGGLCALVAFYLWVIASKFGDVAPEDNPLGEIADQSGDYGFFTPYSWWPLWLALSSAVVMAGVAVGWWLATIGAVFAVVSVIGWTFEHFKGDYAN